jgi:hypothetical protein
MNYRIHPDKQSLALRPEVERSGKKGKEPPKIKAENMKKLFNQTTCAVATRQQNSFQIFMNKASLLCDF